MNQVNQRKTPSLAELIDLKPPSYNTFKIAQVESVANNPIWMRMTMMIEPG